MNVEFLRVDAIQILDNRQRKDADEAHIKSLMVDILDNGLLHPLTLTFDNILVAGFCRLTAIRSLTNDFRFGDTVVPRGHVPIVRLDRDRTALDLFRVEFSENEKRANLTPVERAAALAHLHRNLEAIAGQRGETWTKQQTAAEVVKLEGGSSAVTRQNDVAGEVSDALIIDSFKDDPDVANAPSRTAAVKIAKKKMEAAFTQMLGAKVVESQKESPSILNDSYRVFKGDFRAFPVQENFYHGIIADPPYGVGADSFGDQSHVAGHQYEDSADRAHEIAEAIFSRGFQCVRDGGHLYMFCDLRHWPKLKELGEAAGWTVYPTPLIWDKGFGHAPQVGYFSRQYEAVLFAAKGMTRRLTKTAGDVFRVPGVRTDKMHAAQKPVDLLVQFMRLSFFPGERVVDFTCGSGTIFSAAAEAGLRADGFEETEEYYLISKQRVAGLTALEAKGGVTTAGEFSFEDDEEE